MPLESMPLASGYLKSVALADDRIRNEASISIHNFRGGDGLSTLTQRLFCGNVPDILAFSVFGWNIRSFGELATVFKQLNPKGWVVFGGTHVANQAERVFRNFPAVDVIVNGEGEWSFLELVRRYLGETAITALDEVPGISFRQSDRSIATTAQAPQTEDLDSIPSPFLSAAIPMTNRNGKFKYDVVLMETSRGCPHRCAFCYWGGAVGQRIRRFSNDRLREEMEFLARFEVDTLVLCDANFGMQRADAEFLDILIDVRRRTGFPRSLETSWTKNKSPVFYDIVRRMKHEGLRTSLTIALQTLDTDALKDMNRRNMQLNEWVDLVHWLADNGLDCYAELIWGAPGESKDSFLAGYDRLAEYVPRIATYPLLILPNTGYATERTKHGLVTVRGDEDDFEYLLSHRTMTMRDNQEMHNFMVWARTVAENMYFRFIWLALRRFASLTQSQILMSMERWFNQCGDPAAEPLATDGSFVDSNRTLRTMKHLYAEPRVKDLFRAWWEDEMVPHIDDDYELLVSEIFRFDGMTQPVASGELEAPDGYTLEERTGESFYVQRGVEFAFDIPDVLEKLRRGITPAPLTNPTLFNLYYKVGFENFVGNHEQAAYFFAEVERIEGGTST